MKNFLILFCILICTPIFSQHVGIQTLIPDAPLHVWSNGQVYTPGGLLLLGERTDANLELDFNTLQAYFNGNPEDLRLQPAGGNVGINIPFPGSIDHQFQVNGTMGITSHLYHVGDTDTHLRFMGNDARIAAGGLDNLIVRDVDIRIGGNTIFVDPAMDQVGIGTITPDHTLDVAGDISLNGNLTHNGDLDTEIQFTDDRIIVKAGGKSFLTMIEGSPSSFIFGDGSVMDFTLNGIIGINGTSGQVGINDANPNARFSISSTPAEDPLRVKVAGLTKMIVADDGQVGIGDASPSARLEIDSDAAETALRVKVDGTLEMIVASDGQVGIGDASPSAKLNINSAASEDAFRVQVSGTTKMNINSNGNVGIGTGGYFTPVTDLHVRHGTTASSSGLTIEHPTASRWQMYSAGDGNFYLYADDIVQGLFLNGTGVYSPLSDFRVKKNISNLPSVLSRVMLLKPKVYQMKSENEDAEYQFGFIAQEMKELFPENVRYIESEDKFVVLYKGTSALAIKAIQEQQNEIEELRADNLALLHRIERLEDLLLKE